MSTDRELRLALEKRCTDKHTHCRAPHYKELVWLCLSTDGYKVSSSNSVSVSNEGLSMAWQFIDTISVSSTKMCREVLSLDKRGRNGAGDLRPRATVVRQRPEPRTDKEKASFSGPLILPTASGHYATEDNTIEEAVAED